MVSINPQGIEKVMKYIQEIYGLKRGRLYDFNESIEHKEDGN
jgi:hypothetical protein